MNDSINDIFKKFPKVQDILNDKISALLIAEFSYNVVKEKLIDILTLEKENTKLMIAEDKIPEDKIFKTEHFIDLLQTSFAEFTYDLRRVINGSGVVIHTNLGRSILPDRAIKNIIEVASSYSNLEFNLEIGKRGKRYSHVEGLLKKILNCESAIVVNNNAAAVFMALNTFSAGIKKEVVVSRGELIEIGGSFRIPDIMKSSGARLVEVGTTNKTRSSDYRANINDNTCLLLKVHHSNFKMTGFVQEVISSELVEVGKKYGVPVMEDLGSGSFVRLEDFGLPPEPTVQEVAASGVDIVTFSGDKLLGGPQAGIIAGKKEYVELISKNHLNRAFRIDKLTLSALEAVLFEYLDIDKALKTIPTLYLLSQDLTTIKKRGLKLLNKIKKLEDIYKDMYNIKIVLDYSIVGGGAMPDYELKTYCININHAGFSAHKLSELLRKSKPPIIGKIKNDEFLIDLRTILDKDLDDIVICLKSIA